jgi:putative transposase
MQELKLLQPKKVKHRWIANKRLNFSCVIVSNTRWEAGMTFVPTRMGNAYLFVVEDAYDREALSGHMDLQCGATQAVKALTDALDQRFGLNAKAEGLKLTVRVDRGCQFTAEAFEVFASSRNVDLEFCGVQTPNDKPYIESFIGCYKREEVYQNDYESFFEALAGWETYKKWYNHDRPHGSLNYLSPVQFRKLKKPNVSTKTA